MALRNVGDGASGWDFVILLIARQTAERPNGSASSH